MARVLVSKGKGMRRGSSKDISLLRFEFIDLLLPVHGNDERDNEDEETGSSDPCCLAGAAEKLLCDEDGVGGSFLRAADNRRFGNPRRRC